jgi:predicted Zn-dependent peptidase
MEVDSMGGILNAFTGHEYVCYYAKVLAKFLPKITELLTDIFLHSIFPADEIERERNVILQEIKMRDDSPDEYIHDRFHQNFWNGHPLGSSILGTVSTISNMSRDEILTYKQRRYRPQDIIISAAGNVNHDELVMLVENAYSCVSSSWVPVENSFTPLSGKRIHLCERDLEQTLICLGTSALPQNHPDRYTQYLLSTILGGGMSSRLFQEVREKKGLAYSVYSYILSHADCGALVVYAGTEKAHCLEVIEIALAELARLKNEAVTQNELDSAREQLKGKTLMSLESSESLMIRLAKNEIYLRQQPTIEDILAGFDKVTVGDVQDMGKKLFDGSCLNLEVMGKTGSLGLTPDLLQL